MVVLDPCSGCGRRLSGGARKNIEGERAPDGTWSFWVTWEYRCLMCGEYLSGE
jgi:hypothetical protein